MLAGVDQCIFGSGILPAIDKSAAVLEGGKGRLIFTFRIKRGLVSRNNFV